MDAIIIYRRRQSFRTVNQADVWVIMDLFKIPHPERMFYPEGYRFSWIAFSADDPNERVLFDCHPPKGPHIHINNDPEFQFQWESLEHAESLFFENVQRKFGIFVLEEEE